MTLALAVEIALTVLLAATLIYCAILERRLAALRKGQDGFKEVIAELNTAITAAGSSMRLLKSAAAGAADALDERLSRARGVADELSLLATSGERIATRIEQSVGAHSERAKSPITPNVLANRLDALRPQGARSETPRPAAMGQVR
jgi:Domain of unknown function (DUF6468)